LAIINNTHFTFVSEVRSHSRLVKLDLSIILVLHYAKD